MESQEPSLKSILGKSDMGSVAKIRTHHGWGQLPKFALITSNEKMASVCVCVCVCLFFFWGGEGGLSFSFFMCILLVKAIDCVTDVIKPNH